MLREKEFVSNLQNQNHILGIGLNQTLATPTIFKKKHTYHNLSNHVCLNLSQEIFYYVGSGNIVRTDDRTSEEVGVQIKDKGNQDLVNALTSPDGPLVNGLQPGMAVANEQGAKSLVEAINAEGKAEKKKNKGSNPNKSERSEPKTFEEPDTHLTAKCNAYLILISGCYQ